MIGLFLLHEERKRDFFFMIVQKYLLRGYSNALLLVSLKQFDEISNHKDKIMCV